MDRNRLVSALATGIPQQLAEDLVDSFLKVRQDTASHTVGGAAPGKFVESLVQVLQHLATGTYDAAPSVERFLKDRAEQHTNLDDGLRICAARLNRATYALRNKRNIAHKGAVDPNVYDLRLIHSACQWTVSELLRLTQRLTMTEAGALIELIHAPIGTLVEEIDGRRLVYGSFSTSDEILVFLHSHYPNALESVEIVANLDRRNPKSVRARLAELSKQKLIQSTSKGYRLTSPGFNAALSAIQKSGS
jgi:hypothetical protein